MKRYPGSTEHDKSIQAAIESGPEQLERLRSGVWISDHVDFGLKHAPCKTLEISSPILYCEVLGTFGFCERPNFCVVLHLSVVL